MHNLTARVVRPAGRASREVDDDDASRSLVRGLRVHAGDLHRSRGHSQRVPAPAHPPHVAHERHLGDRGRRFDPRGGGAGDRAQHHSRHGRGRRVHDQHRERVPDHRPHAQDVQEARARSVVIDHLTQFAYLVSTALFVLALKWLSHPSTARRGVMAGVAGMGCAVVGTLLHPEIVTYKWIALAFAVGTLAGIPLSRVPLTAVPQRTALSHAFGGLAAGLVGTAKYALWLRHGELTAFRTGAIAVEVILGYLTF